MTMTMVFVSMFSPALTDEHLRVAEACRNSNARIHRRLVILYSSLPWRRGCRSLRNTSGLILRISGAAARLARRPCVFSVTMTTSLGTGLSVNSDRRLRRGDQASCCAKTMPVTTTVFQIAQHHRTMPDIIVLESPA